VDGRNHKPFEPTAPEAMKMKSQAAGKPQKQQAAPVARLLAWELGRDSKRPLPAGASIEPCSDLARFVEGRLDLLTRNAGTVVMREPSVSAAKSHPAQVAGGGTAHEDSA
jgi:hypothetical protein